MTTPVLSAGTLTEALTEQNRLAHARYKELSRLVKDGFDKARPKASDAMRSVDTDQFSRMQGVGRFYLRALKANPDAGVEAMSMIQGWAEEDRTPVNKNPVHSEFFPQIIRSPKETEFDLGEPPAVVRQAGYDHMLNIGALDAETHFKDAPGFLTNIAVGPVRPMERDGVAGVEIDTPLMKNVWLSLVKLKTDTPADTEGMVGFTEPWHIRFTEARRFTAFHQTSIYADWIHIMKANLGDDLEGKEGAQLWKKMKTHGAQCLLTGTLYLACEWACRTCPRHISKKDTDKLKDGGAYNILNAWIEGKIVPIPFWMHVWRGKMDYSYISAVDAGFAPQSHQGIAAYSRAFALKTSKHFKAHQEKALLRKASIDEMGDIPGVPPETRMPFIERSDDICPLQDAALTTMAPLRFWLCLSLCIETVGSSHLDDEDDEVAPFQTYYSGVLSYLGKKPGTRGRKLGKCAVKMQRLILTDARAEVPDEEIPVNPFQSEMFNPKTTLHHMVDHWSLEILRFNHDLPDSATRSDIAEVIAHEIPELTEGLLAIYMKYSGNDDAVKRHSINLFNTRLLDVCVHLAAGGSAEGYVRSCLASLDVSGYASRAQREHIQGVFSHDKMEVLKEETEIFRGCLTSMHPPDEKAMHQDLLHLANARSAGETRMRFKAAPRVVIGGTSDAPKEEETFTSNRKDILHFIAGFLINLFMMFIRPVIFSPFPLGMRSVPARKLRWIYNVALIHQVIIRPMYKSIIEYMIAQSTPASTYSLVGRTGVPVADLSVAINCSIRMVKSGVLLCLGHDASALDHHINNPHRDNQRKVLMEDFDVPFDYVKILEDRDGKPNSGMTYGQFVGDTLTSWNDAYFFSEVPQAPTLSLHVDSQPSGALITAVDNTIVTMAMLMMIERLTGKKQLVRAVWGDDCFVLHSLAAGESAVKVCHEAEELAKKEAGQLLGTVDDSTSGRLVHYLQNAFFMGNIFGRRMPYDHEKSQGGKRLPGQVQELMDKVGLMASRGGNVEQLNYLQIITAMQGSHVEVFGRQATATFDTMSAPGGANNIMFIGYGLPNSKLFLELTGWFSEETEIEKSPKTPTDAEIGNRLYESYADHPVSVQVGGRQSTDHTLRLLSANASTHLLVKERHSPFTSAQLKSNAYKGLKGKGHLSKTYDQSIKRAGFAALGAKLQSNRLERKVIEETLVREGWIAGKYESKRGTKETSFVAPHSGYKIGKLRVTYSMLDCEYVLMLPDALENVEGGFPDFTLVALDGTFSKSYTRVWHPYNQSPEPTKLMLAFTGVHAGREAMHVSAGMSTFAPTHRNDIDVKEVMGDLLNMTPDMYDMYLGNIIGFLPSERSKQLEKIGNLSLYADLEEATSYASLTDVLKSSSIDRITDVVRICNPSASNAMDTMSREERNVVITHVISLMYDAMNVACVLPKPKVTGRRLIAIPVITIVPN